MAPVSRAKSKSTTQRHRHLPEHLLHAAVLPHLSFKTLSRFKSVCKSFYALICHDPAFASDQSRRLSRSSSGFLYNGCDALQFLDSPHVGIPDRALSFLANPSIDLVSDSPVNFRLLASTNGLVCLFLAFPYNCLCVLNPATGHGHVILDSRFNNSVGLAFDPSTDSGGRYTLVHADRNLLPGSFGDIEHGFDVYSSDTGEWFRSSQTVTIQNSRWWGQSKPVYAGGLLYWDCNERLIWFDPANDRAGSVPLPSSWEPLTFHDVGVSDGRLTYVRTVDRGLEVWRTTSPPSSSSLRWEWEMRRETSWDEMIEASPGAFAFCHGMKLRRQRPSERFFSRWLVRPIASHLGRREEKVYLSLRPKVWNRRSMRTQKLLCYDLRAGMVEDVGQVDSMPLQHVNPFVPYHNTMAALPHIPRHTSPPA